MSYATVDFGDAEPYQYNRPVGLVVLHGPGGPHGTAASFDALVDTGADFMHLPAEAAVRVGLPLQQAAAIQIKTAGGFITLGQLTVTVEIQGTRVNIPVNFGPDALALIGRQAIFEFLNTIGFSTTEWLLDRVATQQPASSKLQSPGVSPRTGAARSPRRAGRIIDHGSWIDIDGLRVEKNQLKRFMGDVIGP